MVGRVAVAINQILQGRKFANGGGAAVESEPTEGVRVIELPIAGLFRGTADEFSDRAGPGR